MNCRNLSNKELAGAMRNERDQKRFIELSKEFITRYCNGELVDAEDMKSASDAAFDSGYATGFEEGQMQAHFDGGYATGFEEGQMQAQADQD